MDRSNRGVLTISGPDRLSWLHSLTSQHLEKLAAGQSAQALILSPTGHVEHHLTLTDDGTSVWVHVEPGAAAALVAFLESMRFMLRVEVADVSAEYAVLTAGGPAAAGLAAELGGVRAQVNAGPFGAMDLIVARDAAGDAAAEMVRRGAALAGMWAFEALRIAARVPRFGLDTDHRTIPHEVGWIDTAVNLNKGCYRGQETVARVHNLGHPPRRLVFLHLDGSVDRLPAHDDPVELGGPQVGGTEVGGPEVGGPEVGGPEVGGTEAGRTVVGFTGSAARHYELGPIGLALVKRTVPVGRAAAGRRRRGGAGGYRAARRGRECPGHAAPTADSLRSFHQTSRKGFSLCCAGCCSRPQPVPGFAGSSPPHPPRAASSIPMWPGTPRRTRCG